VAATTGRLLVAGNDTMDEFDTLVGIMARLRGEGGCPWDRQQTPESLKSYLLEEAYEVLEAVDSADADRLCGELGDLMLIIVFYAQLATEAGQFDIKAVLRHINEKLRYRHPHVFGNAQVSGAEEVLVNWERLKRREPDAKGRGSVVDGVAKTLPALLRATETQKRAARVGFDWGEASGAREKISEELRELDEAVARHEGDGIAEELGDLLFAVVNYARLLNVSSEDALQQATNRFAQRFRAMEQEAAKRGRALDEMTLAEMDELWEQVKAGSIPGGCQEGSGGG